jgi:hypothetical protein
MPSDMDRPRRLPRDFSKGIARLEDSIRAAVYNLSHRRKRFIVVLFALATALILYLLIFNASPATPHVSVTPVTGQQYFHQSPISSHLDLRFSADRSADTPLPPDVLSNLIRSFVVTTRELGVTPWLSHGTLLGWFWGRKFLPWNMGAEMHISLQDLTHLAVNYNVTRFTYEEYHTTYLLDINPFYIDRTENRNLRDNNRIDARWIDVDTGLFIDVTAVELSSGKVNDDSRGKKKMWLKAKDGHIYASKHVYPLQKSYFEGVDCYVPQAVAILLAQEYGKNALSSKIFNGYDRFSSHL